MATETRWVFLYDDAVRVGSGWRKVHATVGWKWVKLKSATWDHPQQFSRVTRVRWDEIVAQTEARAVRSHAALQQTLARAAYYEKHGKLPSRKLRVVLDV